MPKQTLVLLGFIVRAEWRGEAWHVLLHDLKTGKQQQFESFEACTNTMLDLARSSRAINPRPSNLERKKKC